MQETGIVRSVSGDRAEVAIVAGDACKTCGAAGICSWTGSREKLVVCRNEAGAAAGDSVLVETPERGRARSAALVFGVPALLMAAGIAAGSLLWSDVVAAVLAGVGLLAGLAIVKLADVRAGRHGRSLPTVVRVVEDSSKGGSGESIGCDGPGGPGDDGLR